MGSEWPATELLELLHLVDGDLAEAQLVVELAGAGVAGRDLEGDAFGAFSLSPLPAFFEEGVSYTRTPVLGSDVDILDGSPGLGLEGGGALAQLAGEEADHLCALLRDEEAGVGTGGEVGEEAAHDLLGVGGCGVDGVVEGVFLGAAYPEPGGGCGVVPPPKADGEADLFCALAVFAAFLHVPIVADILP